MSTKLSLNLHFFRIILAQLQIRAQIFTADGQVRIQNTELHLHLSSSAFRVVAAPQSRRRPAELFPFPRGAPGNTAPGVSKPAATAEGPPGVLRLPQPTTKAGAPTADTGSLSAPEAGRPRPRLWTTCSRVSTRFPADGGCLLAAGSQGLSSAQARGEKAAPGGDHEGPRRSAPDPTASPPRRHPQG